MGGSVFLGGSVVIFGLSVSLPSSYTIWCAPGTLHGSSTRQNVLVHAMKWSHSSSSSHTSVLSHTPTCTQTLTWAQSCTCCLLGLCPLTSFTLPSPLCSLPLALHELIHLLLSPGFGWSGPLGLGSHWWEGAGGKDRSWQGPLSGGEVLQRAQICWSKILPVHQVVLDSPNTPSLFSHSAWGIMQVTHFFPSDFGSSQDI